MNRDDATIRRFLALIDRALAEGGYRLRVVFTIRSEFEPQFAQSPLKERWGTARFLVPPMTQDELRRVIEEPAAVKVMRFEPPELVDRLVNEVVQMPGALPLLSFALSQMYLNYLNRRSDDRALADPDYDSLEGGVPGALRVRANQVVDAADGDHQASARRVLERMVSVESGEYARRRVPRREFTASDPTEQTRVEDVLKRLIEARLVVTDEIDGEAYIELAHDALIFGWDRLVAWVRQDAALIADLRRLTPDAENWAQTGGRLWSDAARLKVLEDLLEHDFPGLNSSELNFAKASKKLAKRNRNVVYAAVATLALLVVIAGAAYLQADAERERALRAQALTSARLAEEQLSTSDFGKALDTALDGLDPGPRAVVPESISALSQAIIEQKVVAVLHDSDSVLRVFFTGDDNNVLTVGAGQSVREWERGPGNLRTTFVKGGNQSRLVAVSPNGKLVAAEEDNGSIQLWNTEDRSPVRILADAEMQPSELAFSSDANFLAAGGANELIVWANS